MSPKFAMDPQATQAGLSSADAAAASQLAPSVGNVRVGGYATALMGAIAGTRTVHQAEAEIRAAANLTSRETTVSVVEAAEAANSDTLST
jgi:hypothetical protein